MLISLQQEQSIPKKLCVCSWGCACSCACVCVCLCTCAGVCLSCVAACTLSECMLLCGLVLTLSEFTQHSFPCTPLAHASALTIIEKVKFVFLLFYLLFQQCLLLLSRCVRHVLFLLLQYIGSLGPLWPKPCKAFGHFEWALAGVIFWYFRDGSLCF